MTWEYKEKVNEFKLWNGGCASDLGLDKYIEYQQAGEWEWGDWGSKNCF